jgi:hypothetical protein
MEDILHIHGSHDGGQSGGKVIDQLRSLLLLHTLWKPECHPAKVQPDLQLHGSKGDTSPLLDSCYHHPLMVLHYDELLEASHLRLMMRSRQLLLQRWQQDDTKIRSYGHHSRHPDEGDPYP